MKKYVIINAEAIQKRIEGLEKDINNALTNEQKMLWTHELNVLRILLSQSTPLIPEIEKAIQFGKDIRSEKSFINPNFDSPFVDYEDSTEETTKYISQLKLDI